MRVAVQRKLIESAASDVGARLGEQFARDQFAQHAQKLHINEVRRVHLCDRAESCKENLVLYRLLHSLPQQVLIKNIPQHYRHFRRLFGFDILQIG